MLLLHKLLTKSLYFFFKFQCNIYNTCLYLLTVNVISLNIVPPGLVQVNKLADKVNKLADKVGINLIYSNLIGQNYQPWYKYRLYNKVEVSMGYRGLQQA